MKTKQKIDPENPSEESWAYIRESQLQALELKNTSVINTIDLGSLTNVHPKDKLPIGQRLAMITATDVYEDTKFGKGPMCKEIEISDNIIKISFSNVKKLKTIDNQNPKAFWIADKTKNWVKANAIIIDNSVVLSSEKVNSPQFVRYAFSAKPEVNLINEENLPVYPFRTDI